MSEKIELKISSIEVKIKTRKLKTTWSSSYSFDSHYDDTHLDIFGDPRKEKVNKWNKFKQHLKENGKAN